VLWYLRKAGVGGAETVARETDDAFEAHPYWQTSPAQERELRKSLYKALIDAGTDDVVDLAGGLLRMLRRASA
jgi:hypothetical protein